MNVLIIEDEYQAAYRLETLLKEILPEAVIIGKLDTVKKAVSFFKENSSPDLTLMDIHLADGISFEIFQQCEVHSPVIFTTAYDEYAVKAFKVNSIDYILKPVDKEEFATAIHKFQSLSKRPSEPRMLDNLSEALRMLTRKYKTRFVIKVGEHLKTVETRNILYFFSQERTTFCNTMDNRNLIVDYTLDQLEEIIDPELFYRINRKYLVSASAIQDIINHSNSRLKVMLKNTTDSDVIVARERVQDFKSWLDK